MSATIVQSSAVRASSPVDFAALKQRQQATWASGDFAVIGTTLQIVGELLAEAADVRAGERGSTSPLETATRRLLRPGASPG